MFTVTGQHGSEHYATLQSLWQARTVQNTMLKRQYMNYKTTRTIAWGAVYSDILVPREQLGHSPVIAEENCQVILHFYWYSKYKCAIDLCIVHAFYILHALYMHCTCIVHCSVMMRTASLKRHSLCKYIKHHASPKITAYTQWHSDFWL